MGDPVVCYMPGCKNIAEYQCEDCHEWVCGEHAWRNLDVQHADPCAVRCPMCYGIFMNARYAAAMEELRMARLAIGSIRKLVAVMAKEAGLCDPPSLDVGSITP